MSMEALTSISGNSYPAPEIPKIQPVATPKQQEIDSELKAVGTREVGEDAFNKAMEQMRKMMSHKNIQIDNYKDKETGLQRVIIRDTETGNVIREMPPEAVVQIVNKAIKNMESWIFNTSA